VAYIGLARLPTRHLQTLRKIAEMKKHFALLSCLPLLCIAVFSAFVAADDPKIVRVGIYENNRKSLPMIRVMPLVSGRILSNT
jgi:hypothetical protein